MPTVTVSSKHQITLPAEIVRALAIEPGSKLAVEQIDSRIVMVPEPRSWVDYFAGTMRGVYGATKDEIDRYVAEERASWDSGVVDSPNEWRERFADLCHTDEGVRRVVDVFCQGPGYLTTMAELAEKVPQPPVAPVLERLVREGYVRSIPNPHARLREATERYRLVREAAASLPPKH